jgi:hypothetical protein
MKVITDREVKLNKKIDCSTHGLQPAMFICEHVLNGADIAFAGEEDVHCSIDGPLHTSEEIRVWCRRCAQESGYVPQ